MLELLISNLSYHIMGKCYMKIITRGAQEVCTRRVRTRGAREVHSWALRCAGEGHERCIAKPFYDLRPEVSTNLSAVRPGKHVQNLIMYNLLLLVIWIL